MQLAQKWSIFEPNREIFRLMETYNWQKKDWPHFTYDDKLAEGEIFAFIEKSSMVSGMVRAIPEKLQQETLIDIIVSEAIKTSEIEGEFLSREDVISSVRKNLGLTPSGAVKDKRVQGVSSLMVEVRNSYSVPLSEDMLFRWHTMLMGHRKDIKSGKWRTGSEPMQVISGAVGHITVHFEAPPSEIVPFEMGKFIQWFNGSAPESEREKIKAPFRSALAHLWFESIHPFEDGNGRIGRAIAEKALSQGIGRPLLLSLSRMIESGRKEYYSELGKAQHSLEISGWIKYFARTILREQAETESEIEFTLKKVKFFDRFKNQLNDRQKTAIRRMLDEGAQGFQGGMSARKYAVSAKFQKQRQPVICIILIRLKYCLQRGVAAVPVTG